MRGAQDLGGLQSFGPVIEEDNEPLFHHEWERRVFALTLAMGGTGSWNLDQSRSARETLPPEFYLSAGYYRIWLAALEKLMLERDLITRAEIDSGQAKAAPKTLPRVPTAEIVPKALAAGGPVERDANHPPQFHIGDRVRIKRGAPKSHTRVPSYIRGCTGTISMIHGCHIFPDSHARGLGEDPHWLYNIHFDAHELWGDDAQHSSVHVDCWEPYLEPA